MRLDRISVEDVDRYRLAKVRAGKLNATSINKSSGDALGDPRGRAASTSSRAQRRARPPATAAVGDAAANVARPRRAHHGAAGRRRQRSTAPRDAGTGSAGRSSRRWCSPGCGSARRCRSAGPTWTSPARRSGPGQQDGRRRADRQHRARAARRAARPTPRARRATRTRSCSPPSNGRAALTAATSAAACSPRRSRTQTRSRRGRDRAPPADAPLAAPHVRDAAVRDRRGAAVRDGADGPHDRELTLAVYAREMARRDGEPERLRALVEGANWAEVGRTGDVAAFDERKRETA